jgi:hypothetical protein
VKDPTSAGHRHAPIDFIATIVSATMKYRVNDFAGHASKKSEITGVFFNKIIFKLHRIPFFKY